MRVVFAPEVEEDLYGLIKILVEKEYLGTYPFAISYVEELIADIQQNIHSKLKKKAPAFFERYGNDVLNRSSACVCFTLLTVSITLLQMAMAS